MSDGMHVTGLAETRAALEQLPLKMEKSVLRKGLRIGAKIVLGAARAEAPQRSGATRRNTKIRAGRGRKGLIALNVGVAAKDFRGDQFYAGFVLYGWKHGSRKLGDKRKLIPANNWLQRAYDRTKEAAVSATAQSWSEQLAAMGPAK